MHQCSAEPHDHVVCNGLQERHQGSWICCSFLAQGVRSSLSRLDFSCPMLPRQLTLLSLRNGCYHHNLVDRGSHGGPDSWVPTSIWKVSWGSGGVDSWVPTSIWKVLFHHYLVAWGSQWWPRLLGSYQYLVGVVPSLPGQLRQWWPWLLGSYHYLEGGVPSLPGRLRQSVVAQTPGFLPVFGRCCSITTWSVEAVMAQTPGCGYPISIWKVLFHHYLVNWDSGGPDSWVPTSIWKVLFHTTWSTEAVGGGPNCWVLAPFQYLEAVVPGLTDIICPGLVWNCHIIFHTVAVKNGGTRSTKGLALSPFFLLSSYNSNWHAEVWCVCVCW